MINTLSTPDDVVRRFWYRYLDLLHQQGVKSPADRWYVTQAEADINIATGRCQKTQALHNKDLRQGYGKVYLPFALVKKYPNAAKEWGWQ